MGTKFQAYVGPRPFEKEDNVIFFGRGREARNLRSKVIAHNLVLIYAQSGAGKTSLINAGLIPLLEDKMFEVLPVVRVKGIPLKNIKPYEISNIYIFNALSSWAEGKFDIERLAKMKLVDFLGGLEHKRDEDGIPLPRAIIFDQFEEIFSLYQDRWKDREGFFEQINIALESDPLLSVVFSIREEFIAQLDPYADLFHDGLRTRFHIERLRSEAALLAIKEPLRYTECSFAEGVAEKLVDDLVTIRVETMPGKIAKVTGEFIETVQLQVVCQNLWQELPSDIKQISFQHLKNYGDVEQTLFKFYDGAIKAAAEKARTDEEGLRTLCGEALITAMGTRGMVYRAQESTGGVPNAAIDVLESMHLIRAEWRAGARWYELTHDRFIEPILSSNKVFNDKRAEKEREEKEQAEIERLMKVYEEQKRIYEEQKRREEEKLLREHEKKLLREYEKKVRLEKERVEKKEKVVSRFSYILGLLTTTFFTLINIVDFSHLNINFSIFDFFTIIGIFFVVLGMFFTLSTTMKKKTYIEIGISNTSLKGVEIIGIVLTIFGICIILKETI